jgi:DNA invertase Pin-like site-specific DNA recombinase
MDGGEAVTDVFAYLRVSGKGQLHGDGFRRQFIAIRKHCAANDFRIVRVFKERGMSGTKELDDRPALSALFAALEDNGVKGVVIERLDRFARDLMVQETIIADMQKSGYTLFSAYEPDLCSEEPSRILIRQIFGALAQWERAMIVLKLRGARQRMKARHGRCEGRKQFGDKKGEREVLDRMIQMRAGLLTFKEIAKILNNDAVPTRMGKLWSEAVVAKILGRKR